MNIKKFTFGFITAVFGGFAALGLNSLMDRDQATLAGAFPTGLPVKQVNYANSTPENLPDFTLSAESSLHSVVHVKSTYAVQKVADPLQQFFYGQPQRRTPQVSSGSGVIIAPNGYIVTNNHVIENATRVEVVLNDKSSYPATVVGRDPATDIALLKVDSDDELPYIDYGNSDNLKIGEWVLAVGNPFNLTSTVTAGIVSAKGRSINLLGDPQNGVFPIESFIQTDAAVNPGNSGGALVNTRGELIGINTAIASGTGYYTGYSFAVPVNIVRKVVADIVEFGHVQRAFIGVSIRDIDQSLASEMKLSQKNGVYVTGLAEGGAALDAGLKPGDVITRVGEMTVKSVPELQEQVARYRPGDKVKVAVIRDGDLKVIPVTLRNRDGGIGIIKETEVREELSVLLGATLEPVSSEDQERLKISGGAKIKELGRGKLAEAGIRDGFIITSINHEKISSPEELEKRLKAKNGGVLLEGVYPNGMRAYYGFGL